MNFDEGSIILKPTQHSEQTVLFLQSALNAAGTGRNFLTKHLKDGTITIESLVSLWITTFPSTGHKGTRTRQGYLPKSIGLLATLDT